MSEPRLLNLLDSKISATPYRVHSSAGQITLQRQVTQSADSVLHGRARLDVWKRYRVAILVLAMLVAWSDARNKEEDPSDQVWI